MFTIQIDDELGQAIEKLARNQHRTTTQLINEAIIEKLEDYQDTRLAEEALARIEKGDERLLSWEDVKASLHELDD